MMVSRANWNRKHVTGIGKQQNHIQETGITVSAHLTKRVHKKHKCTTFSSRDYHITHENDFKLFQFTF
jgi:hypothetical protein